MSHYQYICLWDVEGRKGQPCREVWRDQLGSNRVGMQFHDGYVLILDEQAFGMDWPKLKAIALDALRNG